MFHRNVSQHNEWIEKEHVRQGILNHEFVVDHRLIVEYKLRLLTPRRERMIISFDSIGQEGEFYMSDDENISLMIFMIFQNGCCDEMTSRIEH